MNEHQYTNIRTYLEGIASKQAELLTEQRRTNDLLATIAAQTKPVEPKATVSAVQKEMRATLGDLAEPPITVETVIEKPMETIETVEVREVSKPKRSTKKAGA